MEVLEATTITGTTTHSTAMHLLKVAVEVVEEVDVMADGEAMVKEVTVMQENMVDITDGVVGKVEDAMVVVVVVAGMEEEGVVVVMVGVAVEEEEAGN